MVGLRAVCTRPRVHAAVRAYVVVLEEVRRVVGPNYSGHRTWTKTDALSFVFLLHGVLELESRSVQHLHSLHIASLCNKWQTDEQVQSVRSVRESNEK